MSLNLPGSLHAAGVPMGGAIFITVVMVIGLLLIFDFVVRGLRR